MLRRHDSFWSREPSEPTPPNPRRSRTPTDSGRFTPNSETSTAAVGPLAWARGVAATFARRPNRRGQPPGCRPIAGRGEGLVTEVETGVRGDLEWGTVGNLVRSSAERFGDAPAIVDLGSDGAPVTVTFRELESWSRRVAKALMAAGIERGDRVAIWATNTWEWVAAALGLLTAGAALVPMNTRFKGSEAEYILDKAGVRAVLLSPGILDLDYVGMLRGLGPGASADHRAGRSDARPGTRRHYGVGRLPDRGRRRRRRRARRPKCGGVLVGLERPLVHVGDDGSARRAPRAPTPSCSGATATGPRSPACRRATGRCSSARSSTRSGSRPVAWPR